MQDAVTNYRAFASDSRWDPAWLPLFANGGGDFYAVDLSAAAAGAVRHFRIEQPEHPVEFSSVGALLATVAAGYEHGIFFVDDGGYLEMEDDAFTALAASLNPGIAWWQG